MLSASDLQDRYKGNFLVPAAVLKTSGTCLTLRDVNPDDVNANEFRASIVNAEVLQTELFGNPFVHPINVCMERINQLMSNTELGFERNGTWQSNTCTLYDTDEEVFEDDNPKTDFVE